MNRKQRRAMKKQGLDHVTTVSICPDHGHYDASCLCPCYDPGGHLAHERDAYGTEKWTDRMNMKPMTNNSGGSIGYCPINGDAIVSDRGIFQCGCFDENGNKTAGGSEGHYIIHSTDNLNEAEVH